MLYSMNRDNMNQYLNELSKELKKEFGRKSHFEMIIVGGASIVINHSFHEFSDDIDGYMSNQTDIKDAVRRVADKNGITEHWFNDDFKKTDSYSSELTVVSKFYRTFNQVLNVRIVDDEYLIAMKLKSFRQYKFDISDIVGIVNDHEEKGDLTKEIIEKAYYRLYKEEIKLEQKKFLTNLLEEKIYNYNDIRGAEMQSRKDIFSLNKKATTEEVTKAIEALDIIDGKKIKDIDYEH